MIAKNLQKIEGHDDLLRDPSSHAVINYNKSEFKKAKIAARLKKEQKQKLLNLEIEVGHLKNELLDIKDLLKKILGESKWLKEYSEPIR